MSLEKTVKKLSKPARKVLKLKYCGAVIVAAGSASRMGGIDKVMEPVGGVPMVVKAVSAFQDCPAVKEIVVVTRQDLLTEIAHLTMEYDKVKAVVVGGKDRAESVNNGLNALSEKVKLAAVHDGARPLVTWELIDRVVRAANTYGGAVPGIPVKDTVKIATGGLVQQTPDRKTLYAIQTPQVFDFDLLRGALQKAKLEELPITDDCGAVEALGFKVKLVEGDERNIKITTPLDLKVAAAYMEES